MGRAGGPGGCRGSILGALLALLAGISRTCLAMARTGDLPAWLGQVHARHRVPHHADTAVALVAGGLALAVDLRSAIGFPSFGVLLYYAIANLSACTKTRSTDAIRAGCTSPESAAAYCWS